MTRKRRLTADDRSPSERMDEARAKLQALAAKLIAAGMRQWELRCVLESLVAECERRALEGGK